MLVMPFVMGEQRGLTKFVLDMSILIITKIFKNVHI